MKKINISNYPAMPSWLNEEGLKTLNGGYLLLGETPKDMHLRLAYTAAKILKREDLQQDFFDIFYNGWLGPSTPVAANFGTDKGLPISCLETGTRIHTPDGFKEIQDLEIGDLVLTHLGNYKPVVAKKSRTTDRDLYLLKVGKTELNITGNHPVLTNLDWVQVRFLDPTKHELVTVDNKLAKIDLVTRQNRETTVWDIEVADDHSFIAQGVVVHNCYLVHPADTLESIYDHLKEVAKMSKRGGGVGIVYSDIRGSGTPISGGGVSTGVVPWIKQYDYAASAVSQGGVRRGAFAYYLDIEHPDALELLNAKDHLQGDPRNMIDGNIALVIRDESMEKIKRGDSKLKPVFDKALETCMKVGSPYFLFIDNVNRQNPDAYNIHNLKVSTSNLCLTEDTLVATKEGAQPIKDLVGKEVTIFDGKEWVKNDKFFYQGKSVVLEVVLENGESIKMTPDHRCLIHTDSKKSLVGEIEVIAKQLQVGDELVIVLASEFASLYYNEPESTISGVIKAITKVDEPQDVYCTKVDSTGYFALANGILTGNCSEITLYTDDLHSAICCLSSLNLAKWFEWKDWKGTSGKTVPELAVYFLDAVMSSFIKDASKDSDLANAVRSAVKGRPIGIGTMGLAYLYQMLGLPFKSKRARELNIETHKFIQDMARKASADMAKEFGQPEWCEGTEYRHTHLCVTGDTTLLTKEGYIHIKDLVGKEVEIWNGHEWSLVTPYKTGENRKIIKVTLNKGRELRCTPDHRWLILDRTIDKKLPSQYVIKQTSELRLGDLLEGWTLPEEYSECEDMYCAPVCTAIVEGLQLLEETEDTYCLTEPKNSTALFNGIKTMQCAIAPTTSNSVITGAFSPGIEPIDSNTYTKKQAKGSFVRKNPLLEKLLESKGKNTPEIWDSILKKNGSVMHLDCLTFDEKNVFLTAREIDQEEIIKQAADRQPYICQAMSTNTFKHPNASPAYLSSLVTLAHSNNVKTLYYTRSSSPLVIEKVKQDAYIITKPDCPYCSKAKELLEKMEASIVEIPREEVSEFVWKTVPQIWYQGYYIGGYEELLDFYNSNQSTYNKELDTTKEIKTIIEHNWGDTEEESGCKACEG